jgi:uncharacterized membrane protein
MEEAILPRFWRSLFTGHYRLLASIVLGAVIYALTPGMLDPALHLAVSWDAGIALFLLLVTVMMLRSDTRRLRSRAAEQDAGRTEIIVLALIASVLGIFTIISVVMGSRNLPFEASAARMAIGIATIVLSWLLVQMLFAVHYAHIYYDEPEPNPRRHGADGHVSDGHIAAGLKFPGSGAPDYWDFTYFSFVVGMTCQVADVAVESRTLRHLVTVHGIISFFYNTVTLALAVGLAANLL